MIKFIYTYYVKNNEYEINFQNEQIMLDTFQESIDSVRKYASNNIIIYTNSKWVEGKIKNAEIKITNFPKHNENWFCFPKIYTYSIQKDPFIHIDIDFILKEKIQYNKKGLICERVRGLQLLKREISHIIDSEKYECYIPCSGIYGGCNLELFQELYKKAFEMQGLIKNPNYQDLFLLEEGYMASICKERGIEYSPIESDFIHLQGDRKKYILTKKDLEKLL